VCVININIEKKNSPLCVLCFQKEERNSEKKMNLSDQARRLIFTFVCFPTRLAIGIVVFSINVAVPETYAVTAAYTGLTALSFIRIAILNPTHGNFGGPVWWGRARLVHVCTYSVACAAALARLPLAGAILAADAVLGAVFALVLPRAGIDDRLQESSRCTR